MRYSKPAKTFDEQLHFLCMVIPTNDWPARLCRLIRVYVIDPALTDFPADYDTRPRWRDTAGVLR